MTLISIDGFTLQEFKEIENMIIKAYPEKKVLSIQNNDVNPQLITSDMYLLVEFSKIRLFETSSVLPKIHQKYDIFLIYNYYPELFLRLEDINNNKLFKQMNVLIDSFVETKVNLSIVKNNLHAEPVILKLLRKNPQIKPVNNFDLDMVRDHIYYYFNPPTAYLEHLGILQIK